MTTTPMPELPRLSAGEARVQHGTLVIYPPDNYSADQMQAYAIAAIEAASAKPTHIPEALLAALRDRLGLPTVPAEPVYLIRPEGGADSKWREASLEAFEFTPDAWRRKLYTTPQPAKEGDAKDVELLDWYEAHADQIFNLGKTWYWCKSYGEPHRKASSVREAIRAAIASQKGLK